MFKGAVYCRCWTYEGKKRKDRENRLKGLVKVLAKEAGLRAEDFA